MTGTGLIRWLACAALLAAATPAAAETGHIGFGDYDITCEGDEILARDKMREHGIEEFRLYDLGPHEYVLTFEYDPAAITVPDLVDALRGIGFDAFALDRPSDILPQS